MMIELPTTFPTDGQDEASVFDWFRREIETKSAKLGDKLAFAHMDPPTPDIASRLVGLNAKFNQNLLHPDLSPFATEAERRVIEWIAPAFGMSDGQMCGGSTLANLTALWCAREAGAKRVLASADAHISVPKSAHILGLPYVSVPVDSAGRLDRTAFSEANDAVVVLTAGTTGRGVIDALSPVEALWNHVDAAWAGPLIFTKYAERLAGIAEADSISISAHKWLYQPKESAMVLFKHPDSLSAVSYGSSYLTTPNVGVQGSRGASAIPLLATMLAWGRTGLAARIEKSMADADKLADLLAGDERFEVKQYPESGVLNWRPLRMSADGALARLSGISSQTNIDGELWLRQVAANPNADILKIWDAITLAAC